ncbi:hypothetical protein ACQJBY_069534 [Aegilops geniculata]
MELRFAFMVHIRRDRYMFDAKDNKKYQGGFDYRLPMASNWSFQQFGEVICSQYPWGLLDEVVYKYYDGEKNWVTVSNDEELATMFVRHKEKDNFHVRLQVDVLEQAFGPRMTGATSLGEPSRRNGISSQNSSVGARRRGGSTSVGNSSRAPLEVEPDDYNSGVDEEKLYSDVIRNLRRAPRTENQDEVHNAVRVDEDAVGEDEDLAAVEWDPLNPHMEEATYAYALPAMEGKQQWDMVDPGFKLCAPVLKRAAGRPGKSRIRPRSEGAGLGARKRKCTRCGGSGHFGKYCDNTVDPAFGESFDEGFDENVGQQPVASTDDENDGQQPVASDEDFDEVPNDDDPKYPPNNDSSEAPNSDHGDPSEAPNSDHGDPSEAPNGDHGDPSEAPNDDPSEARNGDKPSIVVSPARYVNLARVKYYCTFIT